MSQESIFEEFILSYLKDKYTETFEVTGFTRNTNVTNLNTRNTVIASVYAAELDKEFHVFFNENPELIVIDDLFPQLLIEQKIQEALNQLTNYTGKTFVFLNNVDKFVRENYDPEKQISDQLQDAKIATTKVFILLKTDDSNPEQFKDEINLIIERNFNFNVKQMNLECIFYDQKSSVDPIEYMVDLSKNFDRRFPDPDNIIATWIGSFSKKEKDFTSKMRKIQN